MRLADFRERRWWVMGVAGSGLLFSVSLALAWGLQRAGISTDETDHLTRTFCQLGGWALPFTLIIGVLIAPVIEELVFRGFLFTALKNQFGVWAGAAVSSALFAWPHFYGWFGTVDVFIYGMVACLIYHRTQSLAACMILHACVNFPFVILGWLAWSA